MTTEAKKGKARLSALFTPSSRKGPSPFGPPFGSPFTGRATRQILRREICRDDTIKQVGIIARSLSHFEGACKKRPAPKSSAPRPKRLRGSSESFAEDAQQVEGLGDPDHVPSAERKGSYWSSRTSKASIASLANMQKQGVDGRKGLACATKANGQPLALRTQSRHKADKKKTQAAHVGGGLDSWASTSRIPKEWTLAARILIEFR